ncbi:MAG: type I-B CRISPR-associated protein Cas5b [Bacteroidota bacterium]
MNAWRIHIRGWTASFRYPAFISGFQPSLPVPPLTTIYGLCSAAVGRLVRPSDTAVGYVFMSQGKAVDLETIYELDKPLRATANVVKREILFNPDLMLYLSSGEIGRAFLKPHFPLLLGRSTELAMVQQVKEIDLEERTEAVIGGTLVPFPTKGLYGPIQALPMHFTDEIPRRALGTRPFYMIEDFMPYKESKVYFDPEKNWGVWMYHAR